jgi:hypothetical protein
VGGREAAGPGSRGAAASGGRTARRSNGVVFLDGQIGRFGNLESNITDLLLNFYRK